MRSSLKRGALLTLALCSAGLATRAPAAPVELPPPATGDLLIATRAVATPSSIVLVNALGGQTTVATLPLTGTYASSLAYPGDGFVYATVDDPLGDENDALVRVDPTTGAVVTLVDQTSSSGRLASPSGLDVDPQSGDLIFVQGAQVLRAAPDTGAVSVVSQGGLLVAVSEVVVDATGTYAYVTDLANDVVRVALSSGVQERVVFDDPTVTQPLDLVLDGAGIVAVAQVGALSRFDVDTRKGEDVLRDPTIGSVTVGTARGIDIDPQGSFVIVDAAAGAALRVSPNGTGTTISAGGLIVLPQDVVVVGGADESTGGPIGSGGGDDVCPLCGLGGLLTGTAKSKVKTVGKDKSAMAASLAFGPSGQTWSAAIDGRLLTGTAEPTSKKGTKAVLTPDQSSVQTLLEILDARLAAPEPRPTLLLSSPPKLVFKTNKKRSKGVLSIAVKVETDIGAKTYKGALKATLKGGTSGS